MASLCADAGGTKVTFGIFDDNKSIYCKKMYEINTVDGANCDDGFIIVISQYLHDIQNEFELSTITDVIVAASGIVKDEKVQFTNSNWYIDKSEVEIDLECRFGKKPTCRVLNDFEALAYGLSQIRDDDVVSIFNRRPRGTTKIICGPGTGLGLAALKKYGAHDLDIIALSSEGGHQSFAAETSTERSIREYMQTEWVSYEDILSGRGLKRLFNFFSRQNNTENKTAIEPEEIMSLAKNNILSAQQALDAFALALGSFCGNMIYALGATAGVYLWGGIIKEFPIDILKTNMMSRLHHRGSQGEYVRQVPVYLIKNDEVALRGCAIYPDILKRAQR